MASGARARNIPAAVATPLPPLPCRSGPPGSRTSTPGPGTRSSRRDCASRAPGGRSPAPAGRRCSSSAWRPSGTTGARSEPARSRSPARRLPPAAELDVYGRARELPRLAKPVQVVTCIRLGNLVGPVGHDGEAGRRSADLGGVQEVQRLADGLRRLLPLHQALEHPVHLRGRDPLLALGGDLEDELEQPRDPLARLRRHVQERNELQEWRALLELALAAPRSHASFAIFRSCTCIPSFASTTSTLTSARSIAREARSVE